jgi:hypothetical protein
MKAETLGWMLVHSKKKYGDGQEHPTPMRELKERYVGEVDWHWRHPKPPRARGPFVILLAWDGVIFGEASAEVTHLVHPDAKGEFNFVFKLTAYKPSGPVRLDRLPLGKRRTSHRSMIRLDPGVIDAYEKIK